MPIVGTHLPLYPRDLNVIDLEPDPGIRIFKAQMDSNMRLCLRMMELE
jgi:hypothetical protein